MHNIRITSGRLRGRQINTPSTDMHPMGAREKIALFNMIADLLPNAKVLDAYAGSGALGIEAISRGAGNVFFVEKNAFAGKTIRENLDKVGVPGQIWIGDINDFKTKENFNIVIADPPYDDFRAENLPNFATLLSAGGTMILSHPGNAPILKGLKLLKTRSYAKARISIYQKPSLT